MKYLFFLLTISLFFTSCEKDNDEKCCSCLEANGESDKYFFPIHPGMDEWAKLESHQAMLDVCQVPGGLLENMCTIGLVDTYYDYPILFTIFAFSNINSGLQQIANEFNGFEELLKRDNCATKLLTRYQPFNPSDLDTAWTLLEQGSFSKKIRFMEITLAFEPIRNKLTIHERKLVLNLALEKLKQKEEQQYSGPSIITNIYLIGNILREENYTPFLELLVARDDLQSFLNGNLNNLMYVSDGDSIKNHAFSFLNSQNN